MIQVFVKGGFKGAFETRKLCVKGFVKGAFKKRKMIQVYCDSRALCISIASVHVLCSQLCPKRVAQQLQQGRGTKTIERART